MGSDILAYHLARTRADVWSPPVDPGRFRVAVHEAAHAVVGEAVGIGVHEATIDEARTCLVGGHRALGTVYPAAERCSADAGAMLAIAGYVGTWLADGGTFEFPDSSDRDNFTGRVPGGDPARYAARAASILRQHRAAWWLLVSRLYEYGTLRDRSTFAPLHHGVTSEPQPPVSSPAAALALLDGRRG